ncbi:MAG: serine/threonine-protein kinase, partial [Limisphaerales bacterium]
MESSENCPECDAPLLNERLPGQCPECLLGLGLATPAIEVDASGHAEPQWEGTLFGGYRLVRKIARGGMGIVSQAHQEALQRDVALKMILSGRFASADELRRFRIEAEAAAGLDHPHIVPVYDVGEYENTPYLTMALVDGGNLAERMRSGEFPLGQKKVAALVKTLAEAIHHAHQRGVIHRDLKPANILFDLAGQPRIADFGLARVSNRAAEATVSSSGTPAYMAPEQVNRSTELTTAVDVHALGAILFQLLTGRPPFVASTAVETIRKVSEEEAPDPRALNRGVDFDLAVVCRKCLAKAPDDRYATAAALAEDLGRWLNGLPIEARRIPIWIRIVKWSRRRPAVAALAMLSLTLVVSLMTVLWISRGRIEERRAFAVEQQLLAEAAGDRAEREKERLGELLQRLDFEHAESHLAEGKTAE